MKLYKLPFVLTIIFCSILNFSCNESMKKEKTNQKADVILFGNSIIDYWGMTNTNFFTENNYLRKGVPGETTDEILARFEEDVLKNKPAILVIEGGVNDIAENNGRYNPTQTFENIKAIADKANEAGIKVVLTSLVPIVNIHWNMELGDVSNKVFELNRKIKAYAEESGFVYADYYYPLIDTDGKSIKPIYTTDGIHLTELGYKVIEPITKQAIEEARNPLIHILEEE